MRILAITQIFPNAASPLSAPFNRQQLAGLARLHDLEVLATLPWFPGARLLARWSQAGRTACVPRQEEIDGVRVVHPRALYLPRVGRSLSAGLYVASLAREVLARRGRVDVVLGTWAYPDGCAAVTLGQMIGVPTVVKLHGSDMNVIARMPGPRAQLRRALPQAAHVVAVSEALALEAEVLGVPREKIDVVENGVDAEMFHPRDRARARASLGLDADRRVLLYVGNLKEAKGVLDLAHAFIALAEHDDEVDLVYVGDGEARAALQSLVAPLGDRVRLAGARPHDEVSAWMAAADVVTLPSWNEGTPNVVLEALASGRRVVATSVGGVPDLVTSRVLGELVPARQPVDLARALERALDERFTPEEIARAGARGSWSDSAARLAGVLEDARESWRRDHATDGAGRATRRLAAIG
jgi:glycosyltransferase involved in cell wall biosynthesis